MTAAYSSACSFCGGAQFKIDPATFACASRLCGNLRDISAERIRDELNKLLLCDIKYGSRNTEQVLNGLLLLRDIGALAVILPELSRGRGIAQKPTHHRYDVLDHALHTAAESKPMLVPRLAGLLHDVAKPVVLEKNGNMHGHDAEGEIISREIMQRLRYDNKTTDEVCFIVRHHMYDLNNTAKDKTLRRTFAAGDLNEASKLRISAMPMFTVPESSPEKLNRLHAGAYCFKKCSRKASRSPPVRLIAAVRTS